MTARRPTSRSLAALTALLLASAATPAFALAEPAPEDAATTITIDAAPAPTAPTVPAATTTPAADAAAPAPAPVAELVKAVDIPYDQFTLPNGLRVIVHTDRKAPVVAVSTWYRVGSKHEPAGKTGFAHLFEHLMFNGSENAPGDFFEPLQQVGATDFNGTTWLDRTNYFQTVPTGALDRALFLESDRMGHLLGAVTQEKLDNQRGVVQNEKRQGDNQPYGLVEYDVFATLFPKGHPYHHSTIGSMADLNAASLDDVKGWFRDNYGPNNAVLVLAGDIDAATARPMVEKWFAAIPRGAAVRDVARPVPTLPAPVAKVMTDQVPTTRLYRVWTGPGLNSPDAVRLEMAASVLGGLASSRLDNSLVRKDQLAVNVSSSLWGFEDASVLFVQADVKPGADVAAANRRLDEEIARLIAEGPTADELLRVAASSASATIAGFEAVGGFGGKAVALAEGALYSNDPAFYKKQLAQKAAETPATVQAAMKTWMTRPVYRLTVVPGDRTLKGEDMGGAIIPADGSTGGPAKVAAGADVMRPAFYADPLLGQAGRAVPQGFVQDRSKLPELTTLKDLDFPAIERARLSNGVEVMLARRTAVPIVAVEAMFDQGYAADPADQRGLTSLMLRMMEEGTATRTAIQLAEDRERLGAVLSASGNTDSTMVTLGVPRPNLRAGLALMGDFLRNPAFRAEDLARVKAQQAARISAELSDPNSIANRVLARTLFGANHPYGIAGSGLGDAETVERATTDSIALQHRRWLRPDTMRLLVVGDTTLAEITPLLEAQFGSWASTRDARPVKAWAAPVPSARPRIVLVDKPGAPQSVIALGKVTNLTGKDRLEAIQSANDVLGGSFLSRINMNLRETKGWSYGVGSGIPARVGPIAFFGFAPVQADRTGDSIAELRREFASFTTDKGITSAELERTINGQVRELPGSFETNASVLQGLRQISLFSRPDDYFEALAPLYRGFTASQLDQALRAVVKPDQLTFVVVGDKAKVMPQLEPLGLPVEEADAKGQPIAK